MMRKNKAPWMRLAVVCALGVHCVAPEWSAPGLPELPELPELLAASKYIDYSHSTASDASWLCMDDFLAREDRYIEEVAAYLEVDPPSGRIRHLQVGGVEFGAQETWPCEDAFNCYWYYEAEDVGLIRSISIGDDHELVHAVDIPALGIAHRTLVEGLAEYISSGATTDAVLPGFAERFKAMVASSPMPDDYRVAMHFVGSLLQSDGLDPYKRFRNELPIDSGLEEFAEVFAKVYGVSLDAALATMNAPIRGLRIPDGCPGNENDEIEHIAWTGEGIAEATLYGQCGDPFVVHGASVDGDFMFGKTYTIDLPSTGYYWLSTTGPGAVPPEVDLEVCPDLGRYSGAGDADGSKHLEVWRPGRHRLSVGFPKTADRRGEAQFKIEFDSPLRP